MDRIFLGLGSNIGDRYEFLKMAILSIKEHQTIDIINQSSIYETEPFGNKEQDKFLNMVIEIRTSLQPLDLLNFINKVENKYNRTRDVHWGPRTIDIDILLYGNIIMKDKILEIPHPYLIKRLFVLIPLFEIYKEGIPGESSSIEQLIGLQKKNLKDIKLYKPV